MVSARISLVAVLVGVMACRNPSPNSEGDASVTPLEPGEVSSLSDSFLEGRNAHGVESCRCAGDVPFCESETIPPLDASGRVCLEGAIEAGGLGFRAAIPCFTDAALTYVTCASAHTCPEVAPRTSCRDAYEAAGNACFAADPALAGLLAACLPETD